MMLRCAILVVVALAGPAVAEPPAAKDINGSSSNSNGTNTLWYFDGSDESQNTCDQTTWAYAVSKKARVRDCVDLAVDLTRRTGSYVVGNFSGARGEYAPVAKRGTCTLGLKTLENDDKATGVFTVGDSDVVEIVKDAVSRLGHSQMVSGVGTMLCEYDDDSAGTERFMMWRLWDAGSG